MKTRNKMIVLFVLLALLVSAGSALAGKVRKLQPGSYLSTAKIEIIGGKDDQERYETAIAMLDSLFIHYGHVAEGLFWMSSIHVDFSETTSDLKEKLGHIETMVAYIDSLHACCDNEEIKKKFRKNCGKFADKMDSTKVLFWRKHYNDGVNQIDEITSTVNDLQSESDSSAIDYYENRRVALIDSCKDNMAICIAIDNSDARPYIGLASAYEKSGDFETSISWLDRALEYADEKSELLTKLAYNYINLNDYCKAIPYFTELVATSTVDEELMADEGSRAAVLTTMFNLTICQNNCGFYDSAFAVQQQILSYDPDYVDVLTGVGRYFNQAARDAGDSATAYNDAGQSEEQTAWITERDKRFDSALVYFGRAYELDKEHKGPSKDFALISYIRGNYEDAATAFVLAVQIDDTDADNWTWLGDCYISLKKFPEATDAYEHVIGLDPQNKEVWAQLRDLYHELGNKEGEAEATAKYESL